MKCMCLVKTVSRSYKSPVGSLMAVTTIHSNSAFSFSITGDFAPIVHRTDFFIFDVF